MCIFLLFDTSFPRQAVISDNATINMRGVCHKSKHFVFIHRNQTALEIWEAAQQTCSEGESADIRDSQSNLFTPVGGRYRSPPLILIITIFGRSLSDCVYLVPREIDHIPARSVCPRLLSEEHARMFHWLCHRLPNANHNTSECCLLIERGR